MSSAKNKGSAGEREFASLMGGRRVPLSGAIPGDPDVRTPPPFDGIHWEVKRRAKIPRIIYEALEQARQSKRAIGNLKIPGMAVREDRGRWVVAFYAEDFREWVKALSEVGGVHQVKASLRQIENLARQTRDSL